MAGISQGYLLLLLLMLRRRRRRRRQLTEVELTAISAAPAFWVREMFAKREELGEFHTLVKEMRENDRNNFY